MKVFPRGVNYQYLHSKHVCHVYVIVINICYCYINLCYCYLYTNLACRSVCLFASNKRQNGWTDRVQILCGTSRDPREGLWIIKILKICISKFYIFVKFWRCAKKFFCFCFVLYKEKMLTDKTTIKSWNRKWAKRPKTLVVIYSCYFCILMWCGNVMARCIRIMVMCIRINIFQNLISAQRFLKSKIIKFCYNHCYIRKVLRVIDRELSLI